MKCPQCNADGATELAEEVDIGVGVQRYVYGYECPVCGQVAMCTFCGARQDKPHASWCAENAAPEIQPA